MKAPIVAEEKREIVWLRIFFFNICKRISVGYVVKGNVPLGSWADTLVD